MEIRLQTEICLQNLHEFKVVSTITLLLWEGRVDLLGFSKNLISPKWRFQLGRR